MMNSIETDLTKYQVPEDTMEQFQKIALFAKNMTLKDSRLYDSAENSLSAIMGDYLLKYCGDGLNLEDVSTILSLVVSFNNALRDEQGIHKYSDILNDSGTPSTTEKETVLYYLFHYIFGLNMRYSSSVAPETIAKYSGVDESKGLLNMVFSFPPMNDILRRNYISRQSTSVAVQNNELERRVLTILKAIMSYRPNTSLADNTTATMLSEVISDICDTSNTGSSRVFKSVMERFGFSGNATTDDIDLTNMRDEEIVDIVDIIVTMLNKDYFIVYNREYSSTIGNDKLSASNTELGLYSGGSPVTMFDLRFSTRSAGYAEHGSNIFNILNTNFPTSDDSGNGTRFYNIQIVYKEFNPLYREVLDSEVLEIAIYKHRNDIPLSLDFDNAAGSLTYKTQSIVRGTYDKYLIRDFEKDGKIETTLLHQFRYSNPYMCRRANESDIICYFMGDQYVSNGYGLYAYEKNEIRKFIEIYSEVRDYYYTVLLNDAFITDEEYALFEKIFLIFWSIERFIASKLDTLKDIDMYDMRDISNFFQTYGLLDLSNIIDTSDFLNSEVYCKQILKNYIDLVQFKGSRKIFNILMDIFSVNSTELHIYKTALFQSEGAASTETSGSETTDNQGSSSSGNQQNTVRRKKYSFLKLEDDTDNIVSNAMHHLAGALSYESFISEGNDKYWNKLQNSAVLDNYSINYATTKYIIPEFIVDSAKPYYNIRVLLTIVDQIFNILNVKDPNITIESIDSSGVDETNLSSLSLPSLISHIRYYAHKEVENKIHDESNFSKKEINYINWVKRANKFIFNNFKLNDDHILSLITPLWRKDNRIMYLKDNELAEIQSSEVNSIRYSTNMNSTGFTVTYTDSIEIIPNTGNPITLPAKPLDKYRDYASIISGSVPSASDLKDGPVKKPIDITRFIEFINTLSILVLIDGQSIFGELYTDSSTNEVNASDILDIISSLCEFVDDVYINDKNPTSSNNYSELIDNTMQCIFMEAISDTTDYVSVDDNYAFSDFQDEYSEFKNIMNPIENSTESTSVSTAVESFNVFLNPELAITNNLNAGPRPYAEALQECINYLIRRFGGENAPALLVNAVNKDSVFLKFLEHTFRYFISFTAQIYKFNYQTRYDSSRESVIPKESLTIECTSQCIDSFYYDEEVHIEEINS